jgi:MerR family transcriptional regulator, heat shock protein HspR
MGRARTPVSGTDPVRDRAGAQRRPSGADASSPVYIISVAAELVSVHPRTLRIYEGEGLVCPARTPTNIRLYSENDLRRVLWIRHLTQNLGVNLAGVRVLFELEERLGTRILETLYSENQASGKPTGKTLDKASDEKPVATTNTSTPDRTSKEI